MAAPMKTSELIFEIRSDLAKFNEFHTIEELMQINSRIERNAKEMRRRRDRFNPDHTALINTLEKYGF